MKLREVSVKNFRCLADVSVPLSDNTVLVGENNSGKTALLDAVRIALSRGPGGRATPFDEYDYHMISATDSPQASEGIVIEVWFREDKIGEWPQSLIQALTEIIQIDPVSQLNSVRLRLSSKYDGLAATLAPKWEFLALDGQPLQGKGANPVNLGKFLKYAPIFCLGPLRDSQNEFSPRSQFWGRILRSLEIGEEQRKVLTESLSRLNADLLNADPKLEQVTTALSEAQEIMKSGASLKTSIQALPLKPWDLMSRAEVVIRSRGGLVDFPLAHHGQGTQSLAVIFLFQAYIEVLLKPTFEPETEAILALEEPEAHLHPQATRALASSLSRIKSQKIISSHSPYFIQEIPFKDIRMFRREGASSKALHIKQSFSTELPEVPELQQFCLDNRGKFVYHKPASILSVHGRIEETEYRSLLKMYPGKEEIHAQLRKLKDESQLYLSDDDLLALETYAKRIRGEVLFAHGWLLCEGQSEYLLLKYFAEIMGKPLDNVGVTVIDFQNNGSPGTFVALARAFEIPWILVCDNDKAGKDFVKQVQSRGLKGAEVEEYVRRLPEDGITFEEFLFKNGFASEYKSILKEAVQSSNPAATEWVLAEKCEDKDIRQIVFNRDERYEARIVRNGHSRETIAQSDSQFDTLFSEIIIAELQKDKVGSSIALRERLRVMNARPDRIPIFLATAISEIVKRAIST